MGITTDELDLTVCSDHFVSGLPIDDPVHPDYVPNRKLGPQIEQVDVSGLHASMGDYTQEDPLRLSEPEFVGLDPTDIKEELPENIFEECNIKVEPLDVQHFSEDEMEVDADCGLQNDHSYCK